MSQGNPYYVFDLTNDQEFFDNDYNQADVPSVNLYPQSQAGPSNGNGSAVGPIRTPSIPLMGSSSAPYTRRQPRSTVSKRQDLTNAQEFSQAGPSRSSGPTAGPIRSTSVSLMASSSTPYTRQQPRSTVLRGGRDQSPVNGVPIPHQEFRRRVERNSTIQSELAGTGSAGPSLDLAHPALIAKREEVAPWMENRMGSEAQIPFRNSSTGIPAAAWQPSSSTMMTPLPAPAGPYPSAFRVAAQPATHPTAPSLGEWQLESHSQPTTAVAIHQMHLTTPEPSPVQQAYDRLAANSQHYRHCIAKQCMMQYWNGKVRHQVWQEVARHEGGNSAIRNLQDSMDWDLLERYPKATAFVNHGLRWGSSQGFHLRSLALAPLADTNSRDLRTVIPGFDGIPGSLQLLVLLGGERFYDELRKQIKVRWKILNVAIGNALQLCGLVICDEFWKQLETEKEAIEAWRKDFFVDLFDMKNPNRGLKI